MTLTRGYYIGRTEVTQAQWVAVMGWSLSAFPGCDACPVENVCWTEICGDTDGIQWNYGARLCRSAARSYLAPDARGSHLGFRLAMSAE